jgi:hypothetical protein
VEIEPPARPSGVLRVAASGGAVLATLMGAGEMFGAASADEVANAARVAVRDLFAGDKKNRRSSSTA